MKLTEIRINLCPGPHAAYRPGPPDRDGHPHPAHPVPAGHRLRAFCSLTFDNTFVIRDVKLIEGNDGLFLAMPSRKLCDHCPACGEKNHLRARFCNSCGRRLDEDRSLRQWQDRQDRHDRNAPQDGHVVHAAVARGVGGTSSAPRLKLHADIAHPINAECRRRIGQQVIEAYWREVDRSRQPGYVPPSLDGEDYETYDAAPGSAGGPSGPPNPFVPHPSAYHH